MTPEQKRLARVALGLPNDHGRSYQNVYFAFDGLPSGRDWDALVRARLARRGDKAHRGHLYHLTRAGAERALAEGESLDMADFPPIGAH